jgi:CBS domain containing-hemolysin-like protein
MIWELVITLVLVLLNGFFVAAEFAIVKVRASQLEMKVKTGNRSATMAKHIVSHLDGYLAATQLGITLASLALGWIGEPVVSKIIIAVMHFVGINISEELAHDIALPVAFAIISVLHIVFGELAPKSIAIQRSEKTTLAIAYPLQFFYILFRPFIWMLNGIANVFLKMLGISAVHGAEVHSSEEMKYLVEQSKETGAMEKNEYDIIISAFEFSQRTVKQIMLPATKVSAIDLNSFDEKALERIIEESYSRYPVYKESLDTIVGIVYIKDILLKQRKNEKIVLPDIIRKALFIPDNMRIGVLLKEFQRQHQQMAIVVDEYGSTRGAVTMEDVIEELVGEIQDEYDTENENSPVHKTTDGAFIVQAQNPLTDINPHIPHPIHLAEDYTTLAGFILHHLKKIPEQNEQFVLEGYKMIIVKKEGNTIVSVQLKN